MRGMVLFPYMTLNFDAARDISVKALEAGVAENSTILLVAQKDITTEKPTADDLYKVGTIAAVSQVMRMPGGVTRVIARGIKRGLIADIQIENGYFKAGVVEYNDAPGANALMNEAYSKRLRKAYEEYFSQNPKLTADSFMRGMSVRDPGELSDIIAADIDLNSDDKQKILEETDIYERIEKLIAAIHNQIEILGIERSIAQKVKERVDKNQREYYLREQLRVIQEELGDGDGVREETEEYIKRIKKLKTSNDTKEKLLKEADRFSKMPPSSSESSVIRNYLDTVLDLPWNKTTKEDFDIKKAERILNEDHYGLEKVSCRTAGGGKNLRGKVRGARVGKKIRAYLARRHTRRERHTRTQKDVYRRDGRQDNGCHEGSENKESAYPAGRSRQDGYGL